MQKINLQFLHNDGKANLNVLGSCSAMKKNKSVKSLMKKKENKKQNKIKIRKLF